MFAIYINSQKINKLAFQVDSSATIIDTLHSNVSSSHQTRF